MTTTSCISMAILLALIIGARQITAFFVNLFRKVFIRGYRAGHIKFAQR